MQINFTRTVGHRNQILSSRGSRCGNGMPRRSRDLPAQHRHVSDSWTKRNRWRFEEWRSESIRKFKARMISRKQIQSWMINMVLNERISSARDSIAFVQRHNAKAVNGKVTLNQEPAYGLGWRTTAPADCFIDTLP